MNVRKLDIVDIPSISELRKIQELEKNYASDVVDKYISIYNKWLFEHLNKDFFIFGIINEDSIVAIYGLMLFEHHNEKVFYFGNAYTKAEYRKNGLMSVLIESALTFANEMNVDIAEAVIDSSTPDVIWHLVMEKYGATKGEDRYSLLLDSDFRFTSSSNAEKTKSNTYSVNDEKNNFKVVADLDQYISHPLNPSGKTVLLSVYSSSSIDEEKLAQVLKSIMNEYLEQGIYYFKVLCNGFNLKVLLDLGFKKENGYIRWNSIKEILERKEINKNGRTSRK